VVPGRVTWAHDPAAVTWGGTGPWWKDDINNQGVIDRMISRSIRSLTVKRTIPGHGAPWTWLTGGADLKRRPPKDSLPLAGFSNSQLVQRAIENQPLHYRKALLLCEVEEMPYQEICENIGDPDRELMSHLPRVWKYVRESLLIMALPDYVAWTLANSHSFGTD